MEYLSYYGLEEIKDVRRNRIGYIDRQLNGKCAIYDKMNMRIGELRPNGHRLEAYDKMGRKLGYWDENNDTSYDARGMRLGKGNMLMGFFFQ